MEIVVVSDTVRQRRSRTPSSSPATNSNATPQNDNNNVKNKQKSNEISVVPDLLPTTFHLAESSALFSQIDQNTDLNEQLLLSRSIDETDRQQEVAVVEIRETNITMPKKTINKFSSNLSENIVDLSNTCSILESVKYLEPSRVETVHIIDATSEPSDTETCSTPNLDDRPISAISNEDSESENEYETGEPSFESNDYMKVVKTRASFDERKHALQKERDILKDSEILNNNDQSPSKPQRKRLTPTLKEILTLDRDSFYDSKIESFDEPLIFSDDDDDDLSLNNGNTIDDEINRHTVLIL